MIPRPTPDDPRGEDYVASFLPADLLTIEEASWVVRAKEFPFATDGLGNYYTVAFHSDPAAPSTVRLHWHEGDDVEVVAERLDDFVSKARSSSR